MDYSYDKQELINKFSAQLLIAQKMVRNLQIFTVKMELSVTFDVIQNTMRIFLLTFISFFFFQAFAGNIDLSGTWQGVMVRAGQDIKDGTVLYAEFEINDGIVSGQMREEVFDTEFFAVKMIKGSYVDPLLKFKQIAVEKKTGSSRQKWCRVNGELSYDSKTGYLSGDYQSYDCKRVIGKIILFRADFEMSTDPTLDVSHLWFNRFVKDYNEGLYAPEIREIERKNFVFEPIYFDFDKAEIREEHEAFLNRLIHVVKGHSDLRVKVVGHTDAEGSDHYNIALSEKRAKAIIDYFVAHGLSADRLEFDFKGEREPIDSNNTSEGRQRNRRVDFSFI